MFIQMLFKHVFMTIEKCINTLHQIEIIYEDTFLVIHFLTIETVSTWTALHKTQFVWTQISCQLVECQRFKYISCNLKQNVNVGIC